MITGKVLDLSVDLSAASAAEDAWACFLCRLYMFMWLSGAPWISGSLSYMVNFKLKCFLLVLAVALLNISLLGPHTTIFWNLDTDFQWDWNYWSTRGWVYHHNWAAHISLQIPTYFAAKWGHEHSQLASLLSSEALVIKVHKWSQSMILKYNMNQSSVSFLIYLGLFLIEYFYFGKKVMMMMMNSPQVVYRWQTSYSS